MLKTLVTKALIITLAALAVTSTAGARGLIEWGDFVIDIATATDTRDTGVTLFGPDSGNPSPFPPPSEIRQANSYPAHGAGSITVGQIQTFLASRGYATDTFGLLLVLGPYGQIGLSRLVITIAGEEAAVSQGTLLAESFSPENVAIIFMPDLDLGKQTGNVLISYEAFTATDDIVEIKLAAMTEPACSVLLATNFLGLLVARSRLRKRRP